MSDLDRDTARALAGKCRDCPEPALEGELGAKCLAARRKREQRARQRLADAGQCITGCGATVTKQRRPDGTVKQRRCKRCKKALRDQAVARRSAAGVERSAVGASADPGSGRWKTESAYVGGYTVTRYAGRGRHGGVTREEKDDELRIHLRDAVARIQHVEQRGIAALRELERDAGTHSAKREARILAADPLGVAMRLAAMGYAELHPDGWEAVREWARSLLSSDDASEAT